MIQNLFESINVDRVGIGDLIVVNGHTVIVNRIRHKGNYLVVTQDKDTAMDRPKLEVMVRGQVQRLVAKVVGDEVE